MKKHRDMDIVDSLLKQQNKEKNGEMERFQDIADKYASQGFEAGSIQDLLELEGCSVDVAKKMSKQSSSSLPKRYIEENPPESFYDVRDEIKKTVKSASIEDLKEYFEKYANQEFRNIVNRILIARDGNSDALVSEVAQELEPLVDDLIITNKALSSDRKIASGVDEKEKLEQRLFGVWPAFLIKERALIDAGDKRIFSKSKIDPVKISFI